MQKVYFRLGDPYLANYYCGYVMGTGIEDTVLIIGSKALNAKKPMVAHLSAGSVVPSSKWKKLRSRLIDAGRINDPESRRKKLHLSVVDTYEPPTIDSSQAELEGQLKAGSSLVHRKAGRKGGMDVTIKIRRHGESAAEDE